MVEPHRRFLSDRVRRPVASSARLTRGGSAGKGVSMRRTWLLLVVTLLFALAPVTLGGPSVLATPPTFSDVPVTHPYFQAIEEMASAGVINGFDGGTFKPDSLVTRQQFAKMIVLSLGLEPLPAAQNPFKDVDPGWPHPSGYVATAAARGITLGTSATSFSPGANIKRAQISTMMVRASQNLEPGKLVAAPAGYVSDWGSFSTDHAGYANTADYSGLFEGLLYDFYDDPWEFATRGEVAQLLWNLKSFTKQTKTGDDLVSARLLTRVEFPPGLADALEAAAGGGAIQWVKSVVVEHPVNASVAVGFIYARVGDEYFSAVPGANGPVVASLVATFLTHLNDFGVEVGYAYYDPSDPDDPQVASLMNWRLGGDYARQGNETLEQYSARIQPLMSAFIQQHADEDEFFHLDDNAVRGLLLTSSSVGLSDPGAGLAGVRVRVDLCRAYGFGTLIDELVDYIWPWNS
jgi:hypothetical protein